MGKASDQFAALRQAVHLTSRDDYFAAMLAMPGPLGLGDKVRFDHSTGLWHIWNGIRWEPDRTTAIFEEVRDKLTNVWLPDKDINPTSDSMKVYATLLDTGKKVSTLRALASMPGIAMTGDEWDRHPELMGFQNGVLDLRTLQLDTNPSPDLLISRSTGVDWDPNANMQPFVAFVDDIMGGDADLRDYVLRILGYSMLGTNREQQFWMWVGQGQNGKGVLARVAAEALGDYAATPPDTLYMRTRYGSASSDKPRPELLKLEGARFTYMSEPPGGQFNEEMLKAHTGEDSIIARDLYGKAGQMAVFQPSHKIVFLTNDPPKTDDVGVSMRRRVRVVQFEQDYSVNPDRTLEDRLKQEKAGILNLAIREALAWVNEGMPEPAAVLRWSEEYIEENDPLAGFISARCVVGRKEVGSSAGLWGSYEDWATKAGLDTMSYTGFGNALSRRFTKTRRGAKGNVHYQGIRAKSAMELADDDE